MCPESWHCHSIDYELCLAHEGVGATRVSRNDDFYITNEELCILKTMNCVSKTRNCV